MPRRMFTIVVHCCMSVSIGEAQGFEYVFLCRGTFEGQFLGVFFSLNFCVWLVQCFDCVFCLYDSFLFRLCFLFVCF